MSSENVIRALGLSKAYLIYAQPRDRLKQMLFGRFKTYFKPYWALRDVSLEIARGETVGVIGRNGSGKSTFLQMICGTVLPTAGSVVSVGRVAALLELGSGFNPEFTGRENVLLSATILGLERRVINDRLDDIIAFAGVGDFIDQPVKLYSSGMYARLAFAVAAHVDADILILDEILAVGDAAFVQKCMRFIHRFKQNGTLLFVSHDAQSVTTLCDRVVWLDRGSVRMEGPAKDVCAEYARALQLEGDDSDSLRFGGRRQRPPMPRRVHDPRADLLRASNLRNDIELFDFNPNAAWLGQRGASIISVTLTSAATGNVNCLEGGEEVELEIEAELNKDLQHPIIGFHVLNKLGQMVFGDNTYLVYRTSKVSMAAGSRLSGRFRFQMPYLPTGDYAVSVAIATGTQEDYVPQHWVDDALFFRVNSSHVSRGLCGIPMMDVTLVKDGARVPAQSPLSPL